MKISKFILVVLSSGLLLSQAGYANPRHNLMRCARSMSQMGSDVATNDAAYWLDQLRLAIVQNDSAPKVRELLKTCKAELKSPVERAPVTSYSDSITTLVKNFQDRDTAHCKIVMVEANVVAGVGVGAGLEGGHCISRDGRRFIVLGGMISANYGIGFGVYGGYAEGDMKLGRLGSGEADDDVFYLAMGAAAKNVFDGGGSSSGAIDLRYLHGGGLEFSGAAELRGRVKILPLGTNWKKLEAQLVN